MKKGIFQDFDGYDQVVKDIESSRRWGAGYSADTHGADQYINQLHPARVRLRVSDVIEEPPTAKTFRMVSETGYLPPFQAGQYIALFFDFDGLRTSRPYSISSPPNQVGYYDITVRRVADGLVSNYLLDDVGPGHTFESSGPSGNFYYNPLFHGRTMVCIAGGSGITPFMSMVREITERGLDRTVVLFFGNKDLEDAICHDEITRLGQRFENIRYIPVIENPPPGYDGATGFITGALITETLGSISDKTFYLCGPQGMVDFCLPELENLGISRHKIRREVYGAPRDISTDPAWPEGIKTDEAVRVRVAGKTEFEARAGEPLLVALERSGVLVPSLCRSGECSMCRVKVTSGKVFQPAGTPVRKSDRQFGYVHSCVSYPLEDLELIV
ncbi:MAG: 2Fe-2S iron-sulfur cluster binding domain-containing protein [Deltaproteobacteria bacterium]|nr:2Fe-2S iron-sulfur cluster binding domain-containing protein [Deltaproteobacteria bacterium]